MFLTKEDLITSIRVNRLNQLIDDDNAIILQAISMAESAVKDRLFQHYDTGQIFNATGQGRSFQVVDWLKHITLYKLYERVPDEQVPERIVKNYDDTIAYLDKIAEGRQAVDLPRKFTPDGEKSTKFRWGSDRKRSRD
jgi:phage gp36-like protein